MPSTALELVWAAGFLEGEGYFQRGKFTIGATQVNREPLDRLSALFGGTVRQAKAKPDQYKRQPFHLWAVSGRERCLAIAREILPWLSEDRKNRIPWLDLVEERNGDQPEVSYCPSCHRPL